MPDGEPDDDVDEELPQPPRRAWPSPGRPVGALLVAGAVAAGVITMAGTGSDHRPTRTPAPTAVSPQADLPAFRPVALGQLPLCPIGRICETSYDLPDAPEAGLHAYFPDARVQASRTLVARRAPNTTELVGRVLVARSDDVTISVEIGRPEAGDVHGASVEDDRIRVLGSASGRVAGYTITVTVIAPSGVSLSVTTLQELAGDRRLLVRPAADRSQSDDRGQR